MQVIPNHANVASVLCLVKKNRSKKVKVFLFVLLGETKKEQPCTAGCFPEHLINSEVLTTKHYCKETTRKREVILEINNAFS